MTSPDELISFVEDYLQVDDKQAAIKCVWYCHGNDVTSMQAQKWIKDYIERKVSYV